MRSKAINRFKCIFPAKSVNESFARNLVAAFASQLDPKINEIADLKTAVSEAVTNVIVHAYSLPDIPAEEKLIWLFAEYRSDGKLCVTIKDKGKGISDLKKAMEPLFTTSPEEERSGMGFTVMEALTDDLRVTSKPGKGTSVRITKKIRI